MPVYVYSSLSGYDGLVRTYSDDETEHHIKGTLAATGKFLRNSLVIGLQGSLTRSILSGIHPVNLTALSAQVTAANYVGPCSFMVASFFGEEVLPAVPHGGVHPDGRGDLAYRHRRRRPRHRHRPLILQDLRGGS